MTIGIGKVTMPNGTEEDIIMEKNRLSFEICMDILDWFDDPYYDYLNHILIAKLDGEERVRGALPTISDYCMELVTAHEGTEIAYPMAS